MDSKSLEKRLSTLKDTTDHIQALSRWCIQHRSHHHSIVQAWSRAVRKAKVGHRLTLFYVCNDVVQNAKRKKCTDLVQYFGTAIKEAVHLVRDERIKKKIIRIFNIWEERGIYDKNLTDELIAIVEKVGTIDNSEQDIVISTFQLPNLVEGIRNLVASSKASEEYKEKFKEKESMMSQEFVNQIQLSVKERNARNANLDEFEQAVSHLENYVGNLQMEIDERTKMITLLEQAEIFYETQRGEAKLVAMAYRKFTGHLKNLKNKLNEKISTLPEKAPSPVPSLPLDAPSPEGSDIDELDPSKSFSMSSFMDSSVVASKIRESENNSSKDVDHRQKMNSSQKESPYKSNLPETKPMNAKELLDTFGGTYVSKTAPPQSPSSIPFPTASIPPPPIPRPPLTVLPPLPVPSPFAKQPPPTNLSIPLPPTEPPSGPPFPPLPPTTKPSTHYMSNSSTPNFPPPALNGSSTSMWMPPPPPPPLPVPTTSANNYWPPFEETPGDEPPDEEEEDEDARNWGEPPGIEELQTYDALKEAETASAGDKDMSFLGAPPPPPPVAFSFDTQGKNNGRSNLVSIERSNFGAFNFTELPKPVIDGDLFSQDDTDLRVKKKGVPQNEDSGSDMDISEGEASDNEKGRKSKKAPSSKEKTIPENVPSAADSFDTSMPPPTTIEPLVPPPDLTFLNNPLLETIDTKAISEALDHVKANDIPVVTSIPESVSASQNSTPPPAPRGRSQRIESFVSDGSFQYESTDKSQQWNDTKQSSSLFDSVPQSKWFPDNRAGQHPITPIGSEHPGKYESPSYNMDQGYDPPPYRGSSRGRRNSFEPRAPYDRFPPRPRGFSGPRGRASFGSPNGARWNNIGGHPRW